MRHVRSVPLGMIIHRPVKDRWTHMDLSAESTAFRNVRLALHTGRRLPQQVFTEGWGNFEFFDSDWMRVQEFIQTIQRLLNIEGGQEACLVNLDYRDNGIGPHAFRIDLATTEWRSALDGPLGIDWFTSMARLGASSDAGGWCAYCEPTEEIGVMAFRFPELHERVRSVLKTLHALPISAKIAAADCYAFSNVASNPQYFASLVSSYAWQGDRGI
jgi:hypothetical protein